MLESLEKKLSTIIHPTPVYSSLGIKFTHLRDDPLHSWTTWLDERKTNDGAEGLWRIHNDLYDLTDFVDNHPGGSDWIKLTAGTDITEAFQVHHITTKPEEILKKYFVRKTDALRNVPFTFHEDGFYKTLKRKVHEVLPTVPEYPAIRSKAITDLLFLGYFILAVVAGWRRNFFVGVASGIFLCLTANASHNFFHQKDNFRMYYFDFTMMRSKAWRVSHALSHHLYPNTVIDMEIQGPEPFLQYLPNQKNFLFHYLSILYSPIVYGSIFFNGFIRETLACVLRKNPFHLISFLPFSILFLMLAISRDEFWRVLVMFLLIQISASFLFGLIGLNAAHHHPEIFHDGDAPRPEHEMDWGVFQLDAVRDRKDINGSQFLVLTNFGDHALHHLFPTIDHGKLKYLYPVLLETCKEFGIEYRVTSQFDLTLGQFRQLLRRRACKTPPRPLIK